MSVKEIARELVTYSLSKKGAQLDRGEKLTDDMTWFHVALPGLTWGSFLEVNCNSDFISDSDSIYAEIPVFAERLVELRESYPAIQESQWMERDGHIEMKVPIDEDVPVEFIKQLIDEGYELIWNKLDERGKFMIERASESFDQFALMDQLIDQYDLRNRQAEIHQVSRPAALLRTVQSSEADLPLLATKIGGRPDLPRNVQWPIFEDGKPLAFMCQINLGELARVGTFVEGLPTNGLLSVFSVWGWLGDENDPRYPDVGWTEGDDVHVIVHSTFDKEFERREAPPGARTFPAAGVEVVPIISLPNHKIEPALAILNWTKEEYDRFDEMQSDYRAIQLGHWLNNLDSFASHHLLGGYALFQQEYPKELLGRGLTMFLQIGTDCFTQMCWGDGGEVTFYVDSNALKAGRFERIWAENQCG